MCSTLPLSLRAFRKPFLRAKIPDPPHILVAGAREGSTKLSVDRFLEDITAGSEPSTLRVDQ
jgi:hypothetical protein